MNIDIINPAAPRFLRFATSAPISVRAKDDRTIDHVFSDQSVARDGDTIATAGWKLDNFLKNPVYLWAHDSASPPIGRVTSISPDNGLLRGTVQYATADEYPFADAIFRLTKGGYINASSVSWLPIKWRYSSDKNRPGGVDFLEQELLEVSAVPVPALASALVTARSAGIDTGPIFDWATRALDCGGFAVLPRRDLELLRKEAKMAVVSHVREPVAAPPAEIIEDVPAVAPSAPAAAPKPAKADRALARGKIRALAADLRQRGLYELSQMCQLVSYAEYVYQSVCWEAEEEGDGSPLPARLAAWLDEGNLIIAAMAEEETQENLKSDQAGDRAAELIDRAVRCALEAAGFTRSGKVLSKENARCLRDAHEHMESARGLVRSVLDKNGDEPDEPDDDDAERALRARKANALKIRQSAIGSRQ